MIFEMAKRLVCPLFIFLTILGINVFPSVPEALSAECRTFSIHDPIYPATNEDITYTLVEVVADNGIQSIELYEWAQDVDESGNLSGGNWVELHRWGTDPDCTPPNCTPLPSSFPILKEVANTQEPVTPKFIQYKFVVTDNDGETYPNPNIVGYATHPYPPSSAPSDGNKKPAPVYVQGDIDQMMDIVFIPQGKREPEEGEPEEPDVEIKDMDAFYDNCLLMIVDGVFGDEMTRPYSRFFNFYINPLSGIATDADLRIAHQLPINNQSELSFAQARVIMHLPMVQGEFRDHAEYKTFSTEQDRPATMLHEAGHVLFGLADEYEGGLKVPPKNLPNIWLEEEDAIKAASYRHKDVGDVSPISEVYRICNENCQMLVDSTGTDTAGYDLPCQDRVCFTINQNAGICNSAAMSICVEIELARIDVTPPDPTITMESEIKFTAEGTYKDSSTNTLDITKCVTWSSSDTSVAILKTDGLVESVGTGTAIIKAELDGITSSENTLTVQD